MSAAAIAALIQAAIQIIQTGVPALQSLIASQAAQTTADQTAALNAALANLQSAQAAAAAEFADVG